MLNRIAEALKQKMTLVMTAPASRVDVSDDSLSVQLADGRTISVPLAWYPRLLHATPEQRAHCIVAGAGFGIHWPDLDEDLSVEGLLRGAPAPRISAKAS